VAKISKKINHFCKVIPNQICDLHTFTFHVVDLSAASNSAVILPHVGAITVRLAEFVIVGASHSETSATQSVTMAAPTLIGSRTT
jgi:hypothetical protein